MYSRLRRRDGRLGRWIPGVVAALVVLAMAPAAWSASSARPKRPMLKVNVQLRHYGGDISVTNALAAGQPIVKAFFTPSVMHVGTVLFVIRNLDPWWQKMTVNGVASRQMGPNGGTAVIRVTFKKAGVYTVGIDSEDRGAGTIGFIKVLK